MTHSRSTPTGAFCDLLHRAALIGLTAAARHERDRDHADDDVEDAEHDVADAGDRCGKRSNLCAARRRRTSGTLCRYGEAYSLGMHRAYGRVTRSPTSRLATVRFAERDTTVSLRDAASSRPQADEGCRERVLEAPRLLTRKIDGCRGSGAAGIPSRLGEALRDRARPRLARRLHGGVVRAAGERPRDRGRGDDGQAPRGRGAQVVVERPAHVAQRRERRARGSGSRPRV